MPKTPKTPKTPAVQVALKTAEEAIVRAAEAIVEAHTPPHGTPILPPPPPAPEPSPAPPPPTGDALDIPTLGKPVIETGTFERARGGGGTGKSKYDAIFEAAKELKDGQHVAVPFEGDAKKAVAGVRTAIKRKSLPLRVTLAKDGRVVVFKK